MIDKHTQLDDGSKLFSYFPIGRIRKMTVLGSVIAHDVGEREAIVHRISTAWVCFVKWSHFCSQAEPVLGHKKVFRSLACGVQAFRKNENNEVKLGITLKLMVRKMPGLERHQLLIDEGMQIGCEQWLD